MNLDFSMMGKLRDTLFVFQQITNPKQNKLFGVEANLRVIMSNSACLDYIELTNTLPRDVETE